MLSFPGDRARGVRWASSLYPFALLLLRTDAATGQTAMDSAAERFSRAEQLTDRGEFAPASETQRLNAELSELRTAAKYSQAIPLAREVVELDTAIHGAEDPRTAASLNELGELQALAGERDAAKPNFERALAIREEVLGPKHPDTAESLNNLGVVLRDMGDLAAGNELLERTLTIRREVLGSKHPDTAQTLNDLGYGLRLAGDLSGAKPHFAEALAIREEVLGPKHPDTAQSLSNFGALLLDMGDAAGDKPYAERALAIREETLGPKHPDTAESLNDVGFALYAMGQLGAAKPYWERALAVRLEVLGPKHPDTPQSMSNLGLLLKAMGDLAGAKPYLEQALAIREAEFGPEHPDTVVSLNAMGFLLFAMGELAAARPYYERALATREKILGPKHPHTVNSLSNLGSLLRAMGELAEAKSYYERALAIDEETLGAKHPSTATSLGALAVLLRDMGDLPAAKPYFERALAIREEVLGAKHPQTAASLNSLGVLLLDMGDPVAAKSYLQAALQIREEVLGAKHPDTAWSLSNLGQWHETTGDSAAAQQYYARALAIDEEVLGTTHPDTGLNLFRLGKLHEAQGESARAQQYYERSLAILARSEMPAETALVESNYSRLLCQSGRCPEAILFGKQAVNRLQGMRAGMATVASALQESFLRAKEPIYRDLANLLIGAGRLPEAQQVLAMLKEQEYFDFSRRDINKDPRTSAVSYFGIEREFHEEYEKLIEGLTAKGRALAALKKKAKYGLSADEEAEMVVLTADVDKGQRAFDGYLKRLAKAFSRADDARAVALAEMNLTSARALQGTLRKLGPGVVLIHYVMSQDELHLILTTPSVQLVRHSKVSEAELNRLIEKFREVLQNPSLLPYDVGQTLYGHLVAPLEDDLKAANANTLLVYLDRALRYVPLAALYDGEQFVAERFATVVFTAAAQDKLRDRPPVDARLAGLGVTKAREDFSALPAVAEELERIVRRGPEDADGVLPGEIGLDEAFTPQMMQRILLRGYPFVHIASHFRFLPGGNETDSFLLLGDGTHLSLAELDSAQYDFQDLDLLTLSACETGVGIRANGEEVESFGVLAQKKGAASVIATLWSVADDTTGIFMQEFYRLLAAHPDLNKAEALRQVQTMFLGVNSRVGNSAQTRALVVEVSDLPRGFGTDPERPYRHPYYWAPFFLMGNWL